MAEHQTPVAAPSKAPEKKKKHKKVLKRVLAVVLVLALLAGAGGAVWYFVFREDESAGGQPIYDYAYIGSIVSNVSGYGTANARSSASITLSQSGVVDQIFVAQGQMVYEGDPLYVVSSVAAQEALAQSQAAYQLQLENMQKLQEEMAALRTSRGDLTIAAPHAGQLIEVSDVKVGDPLSAGTPIARVVDNTKLRLSLYYSYAYEEDLFVGKTATISVPAVMASLTGTVERINKVRMITPEGGVNFEVVFVVDNPGTMTEGMAASVSMTDSAGSPIYPYADGLFTYYQTTTIATTAAGPVVQVADLMNYADVTAGQILLIQGTSSVDELIRLKQEQVDDAQRGLDAAAADVASKERDLDNFSAVAPITGMVVAMNLYEGMEVTAGSTAITIADNSVMTVNIQVDDRSRQYIDVGMELMLNDWYGNSYMGVVDTIAVIGENQNGVTIYPAVVRVDNPTGSLMGGYGLDYQFTTAQSENCILIPIQDVRYYTPEGADAPQAVVYVKTDTPPENALDKTLLPADMQAAVPNECYVIPVETGLNDDANVEIVSGLNDGDMVYNNTPSADGNYWN